jgi:hypothetical protein
MGYKISEDAKKFLGMLGAILLLMSPYLNWYSEKTEYGDEVYREFGNIFQAANVFDAGILKVIGTIVLVIGIILVLWEMGNYVKFIKKIRNIIKEFAWIEVFLAAIALVLLVVAFFNKELVNGISEMKKYLDLYESKGYAFHGIGPICGMIGAVLSGFVNVLRRKRL